MLAALDELEAPAGPWLVARHRRRRARGRAARRASAARRWRSPRRSADRRRRFEDWARGAGRDASAEADGCAVVINTTPLGLMPRRSAPARPRRRPAPRWRSTWCTRGARRRGCAPCARRASARPTAAGCWWRRARRRSSAGFPACLRRSRSCGPPSMPRFAETPLRRASSAGCCRRRASCARRPVPVAPGRRAGLRALPRRWRAGAAPGLRPLRPAGLRRPRVPALRRLARPGSARVRSAVWLGGTRARRGASPQVRGLVARRRGAGGRRCAASSH